MTGIPGADDAIADGRLDDLHEALMRAAVVEATPPLEDLTVLQRQLGAASYDGLGPRPVVALRLLADGALAAAWEVLRDNAVGVVDETFDVATSSGARRTSWRLPLTTLVEPPSVYAWLPGFRDPRFDTNESAYDITDLVSVALRLDEMWWDGPRLLLAGSAYLRHMGTAPADAVEVVFAHADGGAPVEFRGKRVRRPDFVGGTGEQLTQRAWSGWSAECDVRRLPRTGLWKPSLRVTQDDITRQARLAPSRGDTVRGAESRARLRRTVTRFSDDSWLDVLLVDPLPVRAPRRVLHLIANRAGQR